MSGGKTFILSTLLLFFLSNQGLGQSFEYVIEQFTKDHGLQDEYIKDLDIDSNGNIWILTRKGMVIFDGLTFKPIPIKTSIPFKSFEIDKNDHLWLNIKYPKTSNVIEERIVIFNPDERKLLKLSDYVSVYDFDNSSEHSIWKDNESNIHLSSLNNNIYAYDGDIFKKVLDLPKMTKVDKNNKEPYTISYVDLTKNKVFLKNYLTDSTITIKSSKVNFFVWQNGEAKFRSYRTLHWKEALRKKKRTKVNLVSYANDTLFHSENNYFKSAFLGDDFYFFNDNSLCVYNIQSRITKNFTTDQPSTFSKLEFLNITALGNTIWVGTTNGLIKIEKKKKIFQSILSDDYISMREMSMYSKDTLLISSENGGIIYDLKQNRIIENFENHFFFYGLTKLGSDLYLFNSYGNSSVIKNIRNGASHYADFTKDYKDYLDTFPAKIYFLNSFKDYKSRIWLTGYFVIALYDETKDSSKFKYLFKEEIGKTKVTDIVQGRSLKHIFLLSDDGIFEVNVDSMKITRIEAFQNKIISHLVQDKDEEDVYWIGSKYDGLMKWKYGDDNFVVINENDGLSNNNVHSVFEDDHGRLWLSTDYGISILDKSTYEISILTEENGIHENEMNRHSYCFVGDSLIFYGGINGIIKFNPNDVLLENNSQEIAMKSITYFDSLRNAYSVVQIDKNENKLNIRNNESETKLIFDIPQESYANTLRYIFSNGNNEWLYTRGNSIDLSNVQEGYTNLFVSKKYGINQWSSPKTIELYKAPPFYRNYWFYGLAVSIISFGIFLYVNSRRVNALRLNRRIQREVDSKTKELFYKNKTLTESKNLNDQLFTIIGHDLRSPLISLNNISKSINHLTKEGDITAVKKLTKSVESNSKKSLAIIDRLIDWTETQKNSMLEFHRVNISTCVDKAIYEQEYFAANRGIQIKGEGKKWLYCISNQASLLIVLGNLISNAIKFSDDNDIIEIRYYREESHIVIEVADNGTGMRSDQLHKLNNFQSIGSIQSPKGEIGLGMGILMSSKILNRINGKLSFESEIGEGTTAIIRLQN